MAKSIKSSHLPNRSSAGNRWSPEEDDRLLELVQRKENWADVATALKRTVSGVHSRFEFLRKSQARAATIVPLISTRAQDPVLAPDLTCGALSRAGREVVFLVRRDIGRLQQREAITPVDEIDLIIGALIRELLLLRLRSDPGWLRITISRINTVENDIAEGVVRSIIKDLEKLVLIERIVGYPGMLALSQKADRRGRLVLIRASSRLVDLCHKTGISASDLFTHFPSLRG